LSTNQNIKNTREKRHNSFKQITYTYRVPKGIEGAPENKGWSWELTDPVVVGGKKKIEEDGREREYLYPQARTPAKGEGTPPRKFRSKGRFTHVDHIIGKGERKRRGFLFWDGERGLT
jgi:hypothetical protein